MTIYLNNQKNIAKISTHKRRPIARAQVSFFLPNFDVIRTKEAEMEPVRIACFGRGETEFLELF